MADNGFGAGLVGAGGLAGIFGSLSSGQFDADIARFNEDVALYRRKDALRRGDEAVRSVQEQARAIIGAERVAYATQGVDVGVGSAADVQESTAGEAARAAVTVRNGALLEAFGYKMDALNYGLNAKQAQKAAYGQAAGTALGTAGTLALLA